MKIKTNFYNSIASAIFVLVACLFGLMSLCSEPLAQIDCTITCKENGVAAAVLSVWKGLSGPVRVEGLAKPVLGLVPAKSKFGLVLFANIPALVNGDGESDQLTVLNLAKHPIVCDTISPQSGNATFQSLAKQPRIFGSSDPLGEIGDDLLLCTGFEFAEVFECAFVNSPNPAHVSPPQLNRCERVLRAAFLPSRNPQTHPYEPVWPCVQKSSPSAVRIRQDIEIASQSPNLNKWSA
jgi:hypothetical protein